MDFDLTRDLLSILLSTYEGSVGIYSGYYWIADKDSSIKLTFSVSVFKLFIGFSSNKNIWFK